jgi:hypothetical protein
MAEVKKEPVVNEYDDKNIVVEAVECIRNTDKAILVVLVNGEEHWVPQSHIHEDSEVFKRDDKGKLIITKWIAHQRKLWFEE